MKVLVSCSVCRAGALERYAGQDVPMEKLYEDVYTGFLDVEGGLGYEYKCPKGHKGAFCINMMQHELLFESACLSFLDGAYREAVSSFAAARERFIELYLRVVAADAGVSFEAMDEAWKHVHKSSERQLGAFVWTSLLAAGSSAESLAEALGFAEFRNGVIHRGEFPTRADTHRWATYVRDFIRRTSSDLQVRYPEALEKVRGRIWYLAAKALWDGGFKGSIGGMGSATSLHATGTFDEALAQLAKWNPWGPPVERLTLGELAARNEMPLEELLARITALAKQ